MFQDSSIHSWLLVYQTTTYSPLYPIPILGPGLDSLSAVAFRNELSRQFEGVGALPAALMFDYPSARAIAEHLVDRSKGLAWSFQNTGKIRKNTAFSGTIMVKHDEMVKMMGVYITVICILWYGISNGRFFQYHVKSSQEDEARFKSHSGWHLVFFLDDVDEVKLLTLVVLEKNTPLGRAESAAVHKKVSSNGVICAKWGKRWTLSPKHGFVMAGVFLGDST